MLQEFTNHKTEKEFCQISHTIETKIQAGYSLPQAISIASKNHNLKDLDQQLKKGIPIQKAITTLLPRSITAVESSTSVPNTPAFLNHLRTYIQKQHHIKKEMIQHLTYPIFLITLTLALTAWTSSNFHSSGPLISILLGITTLVLPVLLWLKKSKPLETIHTGQWIWLLGIYLKGGLSFNQAIMTLNFPKHHPLHKKTNTLQEKIKSGHDLHEQIKKNLNLDTDTTHLLRNAMSKGDFANTAIKTGQDLIFTTLNNHKKKIKWITPALLLLIGATIAILIYLTFIPMINQINSLY